jgi:DNA-3-methyladenine glycosylase II
MPPSPLTKKTFEQALVCLKKQDSDLGEVLSRLGPPLLRKREQGFSTLVHIILEQQVSVSSARAVFHRLRKALPVFVPKEFLKLDDNTLRHMGFSRQKSRYCRHLADLISRRKFDWKDLRKMTDKQVRSSLCTIPGIGPWTADIYLLTALRRPDIWPHGDLALTAAVRQVKRFKTRPSSEQLTAAANQWKPWRSVAACILWHYYVTREG